jgi:hypothetical protein
MLINFSNHPITDWSDEQLKTAIQQYGKVIDMHFPLIIPEKTHEDIQKLAQKYVKSILKKQPKAVHIMGELNFTFLCVTLLKGYGITFVASTTQRVSSTINNVKTTEFKFVQVREF